MDKMDKKKLHVILPIKTKTNICIFNEKVKTKQLIMNKADYFFPKSFKSAPHPTKPPH